MTSVIVEVTANSVEDMLLMVESRLAPVELSSFMHAGITPILAKRAEQRFAEEGDDATGKWTPLSEATVERREDAGYPGAHPINVLTGELEHYITQSGSTTEVASEWVTLTFPEEASSASLEDKLKGAQQGGTSQAGNPWPARPVLAVSALDLELTQVALFNYIFFGTKS